MTPRSVTCLVLAAACWTALPGGAALAQTHAKAKAKTPAPAATQAQASPCDILADDPQDPFRSAPGVDAHLIDAAKAVPACKAAVEAAPEDGRLRYAYSRALQRAGDEAGAGDAIQRAAERRYPIAEDIVGMLYLKAGQPDVAAQLIRRSADHGYLPAQMTLGAFYHQGVGVPQDAKQAVEWYRKAAALW